ncbi:C-type lectin domain family 4 member M-like [Oncorhynchus nerka]|uniref:C-type lectin domain family 4 member M-like n=1 Tax=Oncorhynchus nerka TaxID=8023 RepID=UPI0031B8442A
MSEGVYEIPDGFEEDEPDAMKNTDIDGKLYANVRAFKPSPRHGVVASAHVQWWKRPSGVAAVCLGLLCVLLLAGIIVLSVYYRVIDNHNSTQIYQLQTSYNNLTKERGQLQTSYNTLTKERDQLQTSYNTLTKEREQLQTSYNTLTKERDQLQTSYNTLSKERDQLQTSYNTLTKERDQLQTSYNTLIKERDQLQTSYNTLTKERDQLQTSYNTLSKERDQLQTSYNTLTKERDQLQTSYNTLTKERDQLQTSYNTLTKERDQLQTSYNTLTKERDQLQTSYNTLTKEREQLQTSYNTLTKERDQLQTSYNTLTKERDQLHSDRVFLSGRLSNLKQTCPERWQKVESSWYFLSTETKTWKESREDCLERGADLVIINSDKEQEFLFNINKGVWIGLTDSVTEGTWRWVDRTPLTTRRYWSPNQPDNGGGKPEYGEEDCVQIHEEQSPRTSWNDLSCDSKLNWVCEKVL